MIWDGVRWDVVIGMKSRFKARWVSEPGVRDMLGCACWIVFVGCVLELRLTTGWRLVTWCRSICSPMYTIIADQTLVNSIKSIERAELMDVFLKVSILVVCYRLLGRAVTYRILVCVR